MGFRQGAKMYLYDIQKGRGNYYEAKGVVRKRYHDEWVDSFRGFVRFAGDCSEKLKDLSNGACIRIVRCDVERTLERKDEEFKDYSHFLIFDFEIIKKSRNDKVE